MSNFADLIAWFENAPDVFVYHIDDAAEDVLQAPLEEWRELVSCWPSQNLSWKNNVKLILDKVDAPRLLMLLQGLVHSPCREDVGTAIDILSLMDNSQLPSELKGPIVQFLKDSWTSFPEWRKQIETSAKASRVEVRGDD